MKVEIYRIPFTNVFMVKTIDRDEILYDVTKYVQIDNMTDDFDPATLMKYNYVE